MQRSSLTIAASSGSPGYREMASRESATSEFSCRLGPECWTRLGELVTTARSGCARGHSRRWRRRSGWPAAGDLDDAASVNSAVKGVTGIFHMQASHGTSQTATMIQAARNADVSRIVALSPIGAVLEPMPTMGTWFRARADALRASGLDVTYLRPDTLMTNALWWAQSIKQDGTVTDPLWPRPMSCVDTGDIAAAGILAAY